MDRSPCTPRRVAGTLLRALVLATLVAGCSAVRPPTDDRDLRLEAASNAFGGRFDYLVVESSGPLADHLLAAGGVLATTSPMARQLARRLAPAAHRPVRMLVTGWDAENTARVVLAALRLQRSRLPHLELLYLGEPADQDRLRRAVENVGGRFRFAPFRG